MKHFFEAFPAQTLMNSPTVGRISCVCVGERFPHSIISTCSYQLFKPDTQLAGGPTPYFVIFWLISLLKVSEQPRLCSLKANLAQVALQNVYCYTAGSKLQ